MRKRSLWKNRKRVATRNDGVVHVRFGHPIERKSFIEVKVD